MSLKTPLEKAFKSYLVFKVAFLSQMTQHIWALPAWSADQRNAYLLPGTPYFYKGYDWWWHSFVGINRETRMKRPFFIQYFVINPGLGGKLPVYGQLKQNQELGIKPSYAQIVAGTWGEGKVQIHNYYGIDELQASTSEMNVRIGNHVATENHIAGAVHVSAEEVISHPEWMSDAGDMSWDLEVRKDLSYSVGFAASPLFRKLGAFEMFWHVQGMKAQFKGEVQFKGQLYDVLPEESYGYQDKNWGGDYTNPWIWLSCNHFKQRGSHEILPNTSLVVGGGKPTTFGISLGEKVLIGFYHNNRLYDWNFTNVWENIQQTIEVFENEDEIVWNISSENRRNKIIIRFSSPKDQMIWINIENPEGQRKHKRIWNGGLASGSVELYKKESEKWILEELFDGEYGGGEFGKY